MTILHACSVESHEPLSEWFNADEYYAGGATTLFEATSGAFSTPAPNLSGDNLTKHLDGDAAFEATFVTAPSPVNSGLGPIYNNVSCVSCHILDGRGNEPSVFRISIPGSSEEGGPLEVPLYGTQLQNKAIFSKIPEGDVETIYEEETYYFPDGTAYSLRKPFHTIINPYTEIPADVQLSVRTAPPIFGLGLIEAIPEYAILSNADPSDLNNDGISGKANYVYDVFTGENMLGRFGWKANQPNLNQQTAAALNGDMGVTSHMFPTESSYGQTQYDFLEDESEVTEYEVETISFYTKTLAVPAPRGLENTDVMEGKKYFFESGCTNCHVQKFSTGNISSIPEISNQIIYLYSDMLLHDMGEGLADGRTDFLASGTEWKTRPLWGIGLTMVANGHTIFLHDGRARNLTEAIMWHGGEAEQSKLAFAHLSKVQREKLILFLTSL